jgi:hypothetical protein
MSDDDSRRLICDDCEHMRLPHEDGYCYMFREKPSVVGTMGYCAKHTALPESPDDRIDLVLTHLLMSLRDAGMETL